jgi:GTP-binding protein HflX
VCQSFELLPLLLADLVSSVRHKVREADVLIHMIDISNPSWKKQEQSVNEVLHEIEAGNKPVVRVYNKIDLLDKEVAENVKVEAALSENFSVGVSSLTGDGLADFVAVVENALSGLLVPVELLLPYSCGNEVSVLFTDLTPKLQCTLRSFQFCFGTDQSHT